MADLLLGGIIDPATGNRGEERSTLPSSELTTHGVIIGMTGSGKTGLGVVLIEECLAAGVPAILIDPKGDLANLALVFPDLAPADFAPWVNAEDAQKAGVGIEEFAGQQAAAWKEGLAGWEIGPERLAAYKGGVDFTVYTPGSSAGVPVNIVGSLQAPPAGSDPEMMADEIDGYVTSLLGMIGISGDPLSSREHILLANIIQNAWGQGQSLDLPTLLAQVQQPPMRKLGVLELDAFFPPADRMAFAMKLNGLLASPSFATWLEGAPIDIQSMLFTADGGPRCAVVSIAHLSDEQRQSVTALILSKLVTWMRRQSGTSDLRALLYMDEVAGYLPPTANPPTKKPIMLLLKQARAFGLGVVLSTQNPVDLDYKALSNAGTWMIGRLQTEQDKKRVLDGLTSAAGGVDITTVSSTISNLGKRQFLLRRASQNAPSVMTTRWAMSYLRGPLTREQIALVNGPSEPSAPPVPEPAAPAPEAPPSATEAVPAAVPAAAATVPVAAAPAVAGDDETPVMPAVASGIPVAYCDAAAPWLSAVGGVPGGSHLRAAAATRINLRYDDKASATLHYEEYEAVLLPLTSAPDPRAFVAVDYDDRDFVPAAPPGAVYGLIPAEVKAKTYWSGMQRLLIEELMRTRTAEILVNAPLKLYSRIGESKEEFAARCAVAADEQAAKAMAALRSKYEAKLKVAQAKATDAQISATALQQELESSYGLTTTVVSSVLGGLLGARKSRSQLASEARRESTLRSKADAASAKAEAAAGSVADLEAELSAEIVELDTEWDQKAAEITSKQLTLAKSDVTVSDFRLVWIPVA